MKSVVLILDMTYDCNLRCSYCYISGGEQQEVISLDNAYNAIKKIGEKFNSKVQITFHGGEPLLHFDRIKSLIQKVEDNPFKFETAYYIQTNGLCVTNEISNYLKEKNVKIGVSIDGVTKGSNQARLTPDGNSSAEKVLEGIKILQSSGHQVSILSVLTSNNYKNYDKNIDWFVENGISHFTLNPFIAAGRGIKFKLNITGTDMFEAYKNVLDKIIEYNTNGIFLKEKNLYYMYKCIIEQKKLYMCMSTPCGAGISQFAVDPNGDVYPCADFCGQELFILGNVSENFFDKIPKSKKWREIRSTGLEQVENCKICEYKALCPSGCSARRYYANNSIASVDPVCEYYKLMIPYMLNEINKKKIIEIWGK